MTIDQDVLTIAREWGLDPALLQAVVQAEGNIVRAVQCSIKDIDTSSRIPALKVTARSCTHALVDWVKQGGEERQDAFIAFWAARWAPRGVQNDPHDLNANWASNVDRLWTPMG